jgi:hypothetical protein
MPVACGEARAQIRAATAHQRDPLGTAQRMCDVGGAVGFGHGSPPSEADMDTFHAFPDKPTSRR